MQCSQELLNKLDKLLVEASKPSSLSYAEDLNDPAYTLQYQQINESFQTHAEDVFQLIVDRACQMLVESPSSVFRICSIGCGSGEYDRKVLIKICERFPSVRIHYCGYDVNELSVQCAKESLSQLDNVEVEILTGDVQKIGREFSPCDLVLCVHVLYYVTSLEMAISNMMQLLKEDGVGLIILSCQTPHNQLYRRIWLHEHQWPLKFSDDVIQTLEKMGVGYKTQEIEGALDLTDYIKDDFQHPHQRVVLEFITHANLKQYPPIIAKTCIEYLSSIATGKPEQYLLDRVTSVIHLSKK